MPFRGVATNTPPSIFKDAIDRIATETAAVELRQGERMAVVGVLTERGTNLVVVARAGEHLEVKGYIGKTWGDPVEGGAVIRWSF